MGSENEKQIPRWELTYYDAERPTDTVLVGAWEINLAERKHYVGAVEQGCMDAILYAAFKAARQGWYPSIGLGALTVFDVLRLDVARGLRDGRWTFSADIGRDFWSVL
jgi:hypothetical protein